MKKIFLCKVILFVAIISILARDAMADDDRSFVWHSHIAEIGAGTIYSNFHFNIKMLDQFFHAPALPLVLEIIPATYSYSKFYDGHLVSFLTTKLSFGGLDMRGRFLTLSAIFGPFISISPLNFPNYRPDNYILDSGLRFAMMDKHATLLDLEIGSKYFKQNRNHTIYINLSTSVFFAWIK
jgi:hypothetical protein